MPADTSVLKPSGSSSSLSRRSHSTPSTLPYSCRAMSSRVCPGCTITTLPIDAKFDAVLNRGEVLPVALQLQPNDRAQLRLGEPCVGAAQQVAASEHVLL